MSGLKRKKQDGSWEILSGAGGGGGSGTVTGVTATAPVTSTGGTAPVIAMPAATASAAGYMTTTYAIKLDSIASGANVNVQADWNASSGDALILNKPSTLPASDVYAWAKAATKPTYTVGEVGAFANPMTTAGDIIIGGSSGTPARLAMGSALQGLRVNTAGTALEYATISGTISTSRLWLGV